LLELRVTSLTGLGAGLRPGFYPSRVVGFIVLPFERFAHHQFRPAEDSFLCRLFFLEPVAFGTKLIDLVEHPIQEDFRPGD
jgi:hypothetical protein